MTGYRGRARVFDTLDASLEALRSGKINPGDACVVRFLGMKARFGTTAFIFQEELKGHHELFNSCAVITDGRFSGGSSGLSIAVFLLKQRSADRSASSRKAMRSRSTSSTAASPFASPMRKWQRESPSSTGNSPQAIISVTSDSLSRTSVRWHRAASGIAKRRWGCEKSADRKRETCRFAA